MTQVTHPVAALLSLALVATLWGTTLAPVAAAVPAPVLAAVPTAVAAPALA